MGTIHNLRCRRTQDRNALESNDTFDCLAVDASSRVEAERGGQLDLQSFAGHSVGVLIGSPSSIAGKLSPVCRLAELGTFSEERPMMRQSQCPVCYSQLETRDITPCYVCGGWPESVAKFDPSAEYCEFRLPTGATLVLCGDCILEEFMVPGGWGSLLIPSEKLPLNSLQQVHAIKEPQIAVDKFCPSCNYRLAFLRVISQRANDA